MVIPDVDVECYAGWRADETPRRLRLADRVVTVVEVRRRWLAPDHRGFEVAGDDGLVYVLRQDVASAGWRVASTSRMD